METVLITGGTGLIGQYLSKELIKLGYKVNFLSRTAKQTNEITTYTWDYSKGLIDIEAIKTADYIIHLAGAGVGDKRWSSSRKKVIIDSRVQTSKLLKDTIKEHNPNLKAFISASAIGFYGAVTVDEIFDEQDKCHSDFLSKVCSEWEIANTGYESLNIRSAILRIGVVLAPIGGPLEKILSPIKSGFGASLGSGNQYMPWIHIEDMCCILIKSITDKQFSGTYNCVSPTHLTNAELTKVIAKRLNKKLWLPNVPIFLLKIMFGKMAVVFLEGSRVSSEKLSSLGYKFKFPKIESAILDLIPNK